MKAPNKVKSSKVNKKQAVVKIDFDTSFIIMGDVCIQNESQLLQPQPFIFKSTEEIYRDIFDSIKNWVMSTITFLKNIINS